MARELYQSLLTQVASEHFYFWLNSLKEFSHAEQCLTGLQEENYSSALSCIAESLKFYHKGIASLTVSALNSPLVTITCENDFSFLLGLFSFNLEKFAIHMYLAVLKWWIGSGSRSLTPPQLFTVPRLMNIYHFVLSSIGYTCEKNCWIHTGGITEGGIPPFQTLSKTPTWITTVVKCEPSTLSHTWELLTRVSYFVNKEEII